jgi:hypothetical protein
MRNIKFLGLLLAFALLSCNSHKKSVKVHCYQVNKGTSDAPLIWYFYVMDGTSGDYYYYSSPTPVTNFSAVTWAESASLPAEISGVSPTSEVSTDASSLSSDVQGAVDAVDAADGGDGGGSGGGDGGGSSGGGSGSDGGSSGGDGGGGDGGGGD